MKKLLYLLFASIVNCGYVVVYKEDPKPNIMKLAKIQAPVDCNKLGDIMYYCVFPKLDSTILSEQKDIIEFVEEDTVCQINAVQKKAPWGIARISYPNFERTTDYRYYENDGEGVKVYVIDTGVLSSHEDFEGRVITGINLVPTEDDDDENGHGTHVMGTVLGKTFGIAKKASGIAVKVLDEEGSGLLSTVVRGIDWVIQQHKQDSQKAKSVINMSLGAGKSLIIDRAVQIASEAGIHVVVAAGNENQDACRTSPAGSPYAITVGATKIGDERAWFSNFGPCVNIYAPGHLILSAWNEKGQSKVISGTSMASPHVAGVVAALLSRPNFNLSVLELSKKNIVPKVSQGFLFNGFIETQLGFQE